MKYLYALKRILGDVYRNPKALKYFHRWFFYSILRFNKGNVYYKLPWINFEASNYLEKRLKKDMVVFEWGSGASTLFLSKKVKSVVSIEYNNSWYSIIKNKVSSNVDVKLYEPQVFKKGLKHKNRFGKYFDDYVKSILDFPDEYFDLIIIDGRQRVDCFDNAVDKLKKGGLIMFDNTDRKEYVLKDNLLKKFKFKKIKGYVPYSWPIQFETTFFKKIK